MGRDLGVAASIKHDGSADVTAPAVSVIIPCFNGGRFIDGLLASLAAQTFRDFEIVIVDDGSTEQATRNKLDSLDSTVRVIHQENRGLSGARNTGFREAHAKFVLPLDCDDALEPTFLAETVAALSQAPDDVAFAFTHMRLTGALNGVMPRHFNAFDQLIHNRLPYCSLIRRTAWQAVGGYDETMRDGYEDWEFNIHLAAFGYRGIEIAEPLFIYRVSDEGMLVSKSSRMHATLWRRIREKYPQLYSLKGLIEAFRSSHSSGRITGILYAVLALALTKMLPDMFVNRFMFFWLRGKQQLRQGIRVPWRAAAIMRRHGDRAVAPAPGTTTTLRNEPSPTTLERAFSRLRLIVSIVLIAAAFYIVSTDAFLAAVRKINVLLVALSILLFYGQVLVVTWRFQIALRIGGAEIGFVPALEATALSVVAGAVLLSPVVGMILRVLVLRRAHCTVRTLVLATLFERLVLLAVLVVAAIISLLWLQINLPLPRSWTILSWLVGAGAAFVALVWWLDGRFGYVHQLRREWLQTANEVMAYLTNLRGIMAVTAVTIFSHIVFLAAAIAAAHATQIDLGIYDFSAAISATMLLASIPVAISGWGVREISLIWLLGHLGVDGSLALAFSITIGVLSLLAAALASAMSLVVAILRRRDEAAI
jgi:glycosyltransferase involved in cell wall biosynthesis/uncharacterized membrane protein YbhN (UPF0104 family)